MTDFANSDLTDRELWLATAGLAIQARKGIVADRPIFACLLEEVRAALAIRGIKRPLQKT